MEPETAKSKRKSLRLQDSFYLFFFFNCLFASLNLNILFYREAILDPNNTGKPQNNN